MSALFFDPVAAHSYQQNHCEIIVKLATQCLQLFQYYKLVFTTVLSKRGVQLPYSVVGIFCILYYAINYIMLKQVPW